MTTFFVTGTDTGIGKTKVTSALCAYFSLKKGLDVGVMKPLESGLGLNRKDALPYDAIALKEASGSQDDLSLINPYAFDAPVAPETAAKMEHVQIDLENLDMIYERLKAAHDMLFVEGAGGVLVPIKKGFFFSDLMKRWKTTALVVSRLGLGTINHTLLTCRFLKSEHIPVAGVILSDIDGKHDLATKTNREMLARYLDVPLLGVYPHLERAGGVIDRMALADIAEKNLNMTMLAD
ncbi:MAG: dethiobiotin synthase [Syntrophorhabdales bacterium]|jgi:dethiobiotin synthetase